MKQERGIAGNAIAYTLYILVYYPILFSDEKYKEGKNVK